jgi:hypothetical protein
MSLVFLDLKGCASLQNPPLSITDKGHHALLMGFMSGAVTVEDVESAWCNIL